MVIFGMSEVHLVAYETPIASKIRQILYSNRGLRRKLCGNRAVAALCQFNPLTRWIEPINGEVSLTAKAGIPLLRYNTKELGGVIPYGKMVETFKEAGYDLPELLAQDGYTAEDLWQWPFFYSHGRGDCISIMGANIYPDNIENFFNSNHTIHDFKLGVEHNDQELPEFRVYLELREGVTLSDAERLTFERDAKEKIFALLKENNEDYVDALNEDPAAMEPHVSLVSFHEAPFNKKAGKQNHIMKYNDR